MSSSCRDDAAWCRALTLDERRVRLPESGIPGGQDLAPGHERLRDWEAQPPFSNSDAQNDWFEQRLRAEGLTREALVALLEESPEALHQRVGPPSWLAEIEAAYGADNAGEAGLLPVPESFARQQERAGFFRAVTPLARRGLARLTAAAQAIASSHGHGTMRDELPFDAETAPRLFLPQLLLHLLRRMDRVMVLELNVARLEERLAGDTPEARFESFAQSLAQPEVALGILRDYPVLARQLVLLVEQWSEASARVLEHLYADRAALRDTFAAGGDLGQLVEVEGGLGDRHQGGRTVLLLRFSSGARIIYKPRSLAVDVHFQALLQWLNARGAEPAFALTPTLDRGDHGWMAFVEARACTKVEEVQRFYRRQGGYLALLYALEATDLHYENLIAVGEHPVLVDLESLFHPRVAAVSEDATSTAGLRMGYSVLRVGLLPQRSWGDRESEGMEVSGLGGRAGQLSPRPVPMLEATGTDTMRVVRRRSEMLGAKNRPRLGDVEVDVVDHAEELVAGFLAVYRLLVAEREALLAPGGLLDRFADAPVRVILRHTRTYGLLLREGFHPDLLHDALERERFFDKLWMAAEQRPELGRVIPHERRDLWADDVPMFTTRPSSRDLWTSRGARITDFLAEPGLAAARARVGQLGEEDLGRQLWFVRASLTVLVMGGHQIGGTGYRAFPAEVPASREQLLAAARAVGDRLVSLALQEGEQATWLGISLIGERYWTLTPLSLDLYGGLPGVATFLGYLGAVTGEARYRALAEQAIVTAREMLARFRDRILLIGAFSGWGGMLWALAHLGALWRRGDLLDEAEALVARMSELVDADEESDIIGGAAGAIGGLLALHRVTGSAAARAAAVRAGDRLLARAQQFPSGIAWITGAAPVPLMGASHGAAGITLALLELAALCGEERFVTAARAGIRWEHSWFDAAKGNWPDLREPPEPPPPGSPPPGPRYMMAWCHGAPGIGLARARALRHLDEPEVRADLDAAVAITQRAGFGMNHSLCHGDLGNLELLLEAARTLGDTALLEHTYRLAGMVLASIATRGWLCGVPLAVETPGLMTGLAGVGWELLRLAAPDAVPSVLVLEPPRIA